MTDKEKLNGSVTLLAEALSQVFTEAVQVAIDPLRKDMNERFAQVDERFACMDEHFKRLETDMENGFAELRHPDPVVMKMGKEQRPIAETHPTEVESRKNT